MRDEAPMSMSYLLAEAGKHSAKNIAFSHLGTFVIWYGQCIWMGGEANVVLDDHDRRLKPASFGVLIHDRYPVLWDRNMETSCPSPHSRS